MEYEVIAAERLRRTLPEVFARVQGGGQSFEVTSYGRPIARIVPVTDESQNVTEPSQPVTSGHEVSGANT